MKVLSWAQTDVGRKRDHNEDSFGCYDELQLYIVADGMGGHAAGEMASSIAVQSLHEAVLEHREMLEEKEPPTGPIEDWPVAKMFSDALRKACGDIFHKAQSSRELAGMGTTTTAALFHAGYAFFAHVGDSRAYMLREGRILQLSEDHSLVNEQLKAGIITEEQARNSRFKNIITRSVGVEEDVPVDLIAVEVKANDAFVMCSDGLANLVTDLEIGESVTENFFQRVPEILIGMANDRGGDDNITVVVNFVQEV